MNDEPKNWTIIYEFNYYDDSNYANSRTETDEYHGYTYEKLCKCISDMILRYATNNEMGIKTIQNIQIFETDSARIPDIDFEGIEKTAQEEKRKRKAVQEKFELANERAEYERLKRIFEKEEKK